MGGDLKSAAGKGRGAFDRNPHAHSDKSMLAKCRAFHAKHESLPGPSTKRDEAALHSWLCDQRGLWRAGGVPPDRFRSLERLGMDWDPKGRYWKKGLLRIALRRQRASKRHFDPSMHWLVVQRGLHARGKLAAERVTALKSLGVLEPCELERS